MSDARFVLSAPATLTLDIRKSHFIAQARRARTPEEALALVATVRDAAATHNCWAYRVGQHYRFSDDGEPSGTAGKPILQAIDGQCLDETLVVVTRWFGGIKLGAGGLVRAYGGCAAQCLRLAAKSERVELVEVEFPLPFATLPMLRARFAELRAELIAERFDAGGAMLRLTLPAAHLDALRKLLADATRGRSELTVLQ